jgi:hypothetical protein
LKKQAQKKKPKIETDPEKKYIDEDNFNDNDTFMQDEPENDEIVDDATLDDWPDDDD